MIRFKSTVLATGLVAALACPALSEDTAKGEFSPAQTQEIERITRDYLVKHPEVLQEMASALEDKEKSETATKQEAVIKISAKDIFRAKADYVAGNPKGNVTMVEFFDYNCGWCKKGFPEVIGVIEKDKDTRLVLKEFPIFGEDSEYAARTAIAAHMQGKYWELHQALFKHDGKVTKQVVDEATATLKLDQDKLTADRNSAETTAVLADNAKLGQALSINGTPAFIIADKLVPGYLPAADLHGIIDEARKSNSCKNLC